MSVAAMTLRVDQSLKDQLARIGELRHIPMNKLANQALQKFVDQETALLEAELEASLSHLRKYRAANPGFEQAIDQMARAEVMAKDDPAEGVELGQLAAKLPDDYEATALLRSMLRG